MCYVKLLVNGVYLSFEVLSVKITVFRDVTACSLIGSSEMLMPLYRTMRCHRLEDSNC